MHAIPSVVTRRYMSDILSCAFLFKQDAWHLPHNGFMLYVIKAKVLHYLNTDYYTSWSRYILVRRILCSFIRRLSRGFCVSQHVILMCRRCQVSFLRILNVGKVLSGSLKRNYADVNLTFPRSYDYISIKDTILKVACIPTQVCLSVHSRWYPLLTDYISYKSSLDDI